MQQFVTLRRIFAAILTCLLMGGMLFSSAPSFASGQEKKVLFIFADGPDYPYTKMIIDGFQEMVNRENRNIRILNYYEYLETTRFLSDPAYFENLADYLNKKYRLNQPDLIVLHGLSTNVYMTRYGVKTFPGVPVIYTAYALDREKAGDYPALYTGVVAPFDLPSAILTMLKVQPDIRKIYLILGDSEDERKVTPQYQKDLSALKTQAEYIWLNQMPIDQLLKTVQTLDSQSAIQFINFHRDVKGNVFIPAQILREIAKQASVPVYGTLQTHMGTGAVGGNLISFTAMGMQSAQIGLELLAGRKPDKNSLDNAVLTANVFDWRVLKRWDISESKLPPNSRVEFRQPSILDEYQHEIAGGLLLIFLQGFMIVVLLRSRAVRKQQAQQILEADQFTREIIRSVQEGIIVYDCNLRYQVWNSYMETLSGMKASDVLGKTPQEVFPFVEKTGVLKQLESVLEQGKTYESEFQYEVPVSQKTGWAVDHSSPLKNSKGELIGVLATVHDITMRKHWEDALKESEERYRAMMQQSSDAIAIVEISTRRIVEANPKWLKVLGYEQEDIRNLTAYDVVNQKREILDRIYEQFLNEGVLPAKVVRFRRKDGRMIEMERAGSVIRFGGEKFFVFVNRDITGERKLQQQIALDVMLAEEVQKSLLPHDVDDLLVEVRSIYEPYHKVSGDFFNFSWNPAHTKLYGFVLDVSGHGVASSLQGQAVSSYFREIMESPMNLVERLKWVNQQVLRYFTDETFAAAICFEFDFSSQTLTFSTAGIFMFLASSGELPKKVNKPGSLLGIADVPEYEEWVVALKPDDAFYFMTDGIFELLPEDEKLNPSNFNEMVDLLTDISRRPNRHDDCCALCIRIKGKPVFPIRFRSERPREIMRVRTRIRHLLQSLTPNEAGRIEVAVGEALNNAMRESPKITIKFSRFGSLLVFRVRDAGEGFEGNAKVEAFLAANTEESFNERLLEECGRGILIMASWMDRVVYNRKGNEVLMMKKIKP